MKFYTQEDKLKFAFMCFDDEGNGVITKAELLKVEAILAASTFIFPYKIHVPMLFVWGSDASTFLLAAKIHADRIKSGKKRHTPAA